MPSPPLPAPTIPPSQIHLTTHLLGRGSFGTVHRGYFSGSPVAIKICNLSSNTPPSPTSRSALIQFRRETARYTALHHPCITQFFGVVSQPESHQLLLVTELMKGGSLYDALTRLRTAAVKRLPFDAILRMALDVTNGLAYLHASSFSFGDLKTMNVLLSAPVDVKRATIPPTVKAKLCDFGLSRNLKHLVDSDAPPRPDETLIAARNGPAGTFAYMAPEAFRGLPVDDAEAPKRADIFALGVVLWELATMRRPWPGKQAFQLVRLVGVEGERLAWGRELAWLPPRFVELVQWCWAEDALQRPTVEQVAKVLEDLTHDFEAGEFDALSSFEDGDSYVVDGRHGSVKDIMHNGSVADDADIRNVEEEVLGTEEFQNFRVRLGMAGRGESTEVGVGDTELSDVTGELQRTRSHSRMSDHDDESLVRYVETEERTKSMLMLDQVAGLTEELEEEFDGVFESGVVESGFAGYLEAEEENKSMILDGARPLSEDYEEGVEGCTGGECEDSAVAEYVETEERTKSKVMSEGFLGVGEGLEDKFAALNMGDALVHAVKDSGIEYLEIEARTKSAEMSTGIMSVGGGKIGVGIGDVMDKIGEENQPESGEEAFVEELNASKSALISPGGVEELKSAEKKVGIVKWGSKSVGQNIETGGVPVRKLRSKSYIVPRVCTLDLEVEMELENMYRIPSKRLAFDNLEDEGRQQKSGDREEKLAGVKTGTGKGIGTEKRRMGLLRSRRLYNVGMVDWSGTNEEISRWEEDELDVRQSGVNMFSRPHFK